jgi:hypothetical protein
MANNQPPRIVVRELDIALACPAPCFQATTEEECFRHIKTWTSNQLWRKKVTILSAVDSFQQMGMNVDAINFFSQVGVLNLYVIAAALHSITFHIQLSLGGCVDSQPLRNMLSNWKTVWNSRALPRNNPPFGIAAYEIGTGEDARNDWRRDGFFKFAPEVWLFSKKLWYIESSKVRPMQRSLGGIEVTSPNEFLGDIAHDLPEQDKYDDTSMIQLSLLLNSFEAMKF